MKQLLICTILFCATRSNGQTVFFQSNQTYSEKDLTSSYSSIALQNNLLLFNAPDYGLYAYDRTGRQLWKYDLGRKSNQPPFFAGKWVWAVGRESQVWQLDSATGATMKKLPFSELETPPIQRNGILYGTAIYDGGCLYAYDLKADSVVWQRFLAHGCSIKPYYQAEKIVANAEGDNWLEIRYDGKLVDTQCDDAEITYPSGLSCIKNFAALSHDGKEIKGKLAQTLLPDGYFNNEIFYTAQNSFVLHEGTLTVLGNKLKKKLSVDLNTINDSIQEQEEGLAKILAADDQTVSLVYNNQFIIYDFKKKKSVKTVDLNNWGPHQVILDENRLWLISKKDGRLYGLNL